MNIYISVFATVSASFQTGQPINKHYMLYCTFPSPFSSSFGRTGSNVFLPPVFPVKLCKGQVSSGGQFLRHLNTRNCVGCLQWTGGAGSKTQSDRPRSPAQGQRAVSWAMVSSCPSSLIHYLFSYLCGSECVWGCVCVCEEAAFVYYLRFVC